jgi:imidazolonepropionase-like amidohydrolase/2-keto-3-deoxy-L-rhamnonate aldolase RhmA
MNDRLIATAVGTLILLTAGHAAAQAPAQGAGAGQQPAYAIASPPVTSPLAAPAGKDSGALRTALPNGVNQGPFDPATWKYGPAFNPPPGAKIWNPVRAKMLAGQKVTGGTLFNVVDPTVYCSMANAGYDFIWTEMQHSSVTWDQTAKMWGACPYARAVPGARVAYTNEQEIQHAVDNGALVVVVPTVDTVEEATAARDWAFFPPLGRRSAGGGYAFAASMYGSVPGGYRQTFNDNLVLILMIETLEGVKNAAAIAKVPGVTAIFAASGDLGNFSGYAQGDQRGRAALRTVRVARATGLHVLSEPAARRRSGDRRAGRARRALEHHRQSRSRAVGRPIARPHGLCVALALAVASAASAQQPSVDLVLINGTVITVNARGTVAQAIAVEDGRIVAVGSTTQIRALAGSTTRVVDLGRKFVMPTLISTHVHPGFQKGAAYVAANFGRETVLEDLNRALYFGVSVVQSQGIEPGDVLYRIRAEQAAGALGGARLLVAGRGIGAPNAGPGAAAYAGIAYEITTVAEARRAVTELAASRVDVVKVWVDDRNGRAPRLGSNLYRAVIDAGHQRGLRVNAHVFYHSDAEGLVAAGIDGLVHLVRDVEMSDALVAAIVNGGVGVNANLSNPRRGTQVGVPSWLLPGDPMRKLLNESAAPDLVAKIEAAFQQRDPQAAAEARERYAILERSLVKLSNAGAKLVLGADTGVEDHLFGVAEHLELEAMVDAGMTPEQVLVSATSRAAEYLHLDDRGSLATGKRADLLVLDASPLVDIANTRRIARVLIDGAEIDRAALRAQLAK